MEENIAPSIFDDLGNDARYVVHAGMGLRFAGFVIDLIVFFIINYCVFVSIGIILMLAGHTRQEISDTFTYGVLTYSIMFAEIVIVYTLMEGITKGRSLGKRITRTQVIREDRKPITFRNALVRTLCRLVPFEPISIFFNLENTMWHDKWSGTIVIKRGKFVF